MAINPSLSPPNIKVFQVQQTQTPVIAAPQLYPFITGPCKEIVNALNDDGTLNSAAKEGSYNQLPLLVSQSAFPSPRNNIDQVTVEEDTIRVFNDFSGTVKELPMNPGSAFLTAYNHSTKAVMRSTQNANYTLVGKTLVLSVDNPVNVNPVNDVAITFTGTDPLTPQQVADQINLAVGKTIVTVVTLPSEMNPRLEFASPTFGALSSLTIRAGGSANSTIGLGSSSEVRVEGSGFRGQEDNFGGDTLTPWIEWFRGEYYSNGTATTFPGGVQFGQKYASDDLDNPDVFVNAKTSAVTFGSTGTIDLKVGDAFYADGIQVKSAEISKVEASRFKLGTVNPTLSVFDSNGKPVSIVRDTVQIALLTDPVPFAPRYAYFIAQYIKTSSATAATLTGTQQGQPATTATIQSTTTVASFAVAGLNLRVTVTVDDVEQNETIFTFPGGSYAAIGDIVTAIGSNIPGVVATSSSGKLVLSTTLFGKAQAIKLAATSTANSTLNFSTVSDTTDVGSDVEFVATPAVLTTSGNSFAMTVAAAQTLIVDLSTDGGSTFTSYTHTESLTSFANIGALVSALSADSGFITGTNFTASASGNELVLTSVDTGLNVVLRVNSGSTEIGTGKIRFTSGQLANGQDGIQGKTFKFTINDRPKIYTTVFTSNSLTDAISEINQSVGATVGSTGGTAGRQLKLTSTLKGYGSSVRIVSDVTTASTINAFGFLPSNNVATGAGRPLPDAYLSGNGNVTISAEILRNPVTGYPFDPAVSMLYIQYRALRLDVSPSAKNASMLEIATQDDLASLLGPITEENPLALGIYFAMLNAPNTIIKALGVDEISAIYPEGTPAAYQRVIDFTTTHEIYAIAPLTQVEEVHRLFETHVKDIERPERENAQRERRVYINPLVPTRALDSIVASGLSANTPVATTNQINLDVNPSASLLSFGINPALAIPYSAQLYLKLTHNNVIKRYSVAQVTGVHIALRNTFQSGENTDDYFEKTPLDYVVINGDWSMNIRGAALTLPSSSTPDKQKIAQTVNQYAQTYKHRRISYIFGDTVLAPLGGLTQQIPGYYAASAYAGVNAYQRPQQPLSNFLINGFTGAQGTKGFFSEDQMNIIAGGGVMILVNDKAGLPIYARHQLTTDVSSVEVQEDSILRALDTTALLMRTRLKQFLGNRNITPDLLGDIATLIDSVKAFLIEEVGCLRDLKVISLKENPLRPDSIVIELAVTVFYPLNEIQLYIYF